MLNIFSNQHFLLVYRAWNELCGAPIDYDAYTRFVSAADVAEGAQIAALPVDGWEATAAID